MDGVTRYGFRIVGLVATEPVLLVVLPLIYFIPGDRIGIALGVVGLTLAIVAPVLSARRRGLTCWSGGLLVQLDGYRLSVGWEDLLRVQRVRRRGVLAVDELVFARGTADPVSSRGRKGRLPPDVGEHPGETRVMVSLFDKDWRRGPIGSHARAAGLDV